MKFLQRNFQKFLNLFLEQNCPLCQRSTPDRLCEDCTRSLIACRLSNPTIRSQKDYPVVIWGAYQHALKRAITTMKYNNHPEIGQPLGYWLGEIWLEYATSPHVPSPHECIAIPIPLNRHKQKTRGFNQAEVIAKCFCEVTGIKLVADGLVRSRQTQAQHLLTASDRAKNLANAFDVGTSLPAYRGRSIILVDDIYTTGATVNSAIQTLALHRYHTLGVVAVATTHQESLRKI